MQTVILKLTVALFLSLFLFSCSNVKHIEIKDENGLVKESYFQDKTGLLQGTKTKYIDGVKFSEENYSNGKLEGPRLLFFSNGEIEIEENYKSDILDGHFKSFYKSGVLQQEASYTAGALTGIVKTYYEEGPIKEEVTFVNNEENGPFKEYYLNGQLSWEGQYVNGDNELGIIVNYGENGEMIKKMQCDTIMGFSKCKTIWPES